MSLDVERIRRDFPLLSAEDPPAYLDNACMTFKPRAVIDAVVEYYERFPVCAGRAAYDLSRELGIRVDDARRSFARFLGVADAARLVWTKNATEALNLVAHAFRFRRGEVVLTTDREHNSNFVPWQVARARAGIVHDVLATPEDGRFDLEGYERRLARGDVRLVAMAQATNLDGSSIPARDVIRIAREHGARVLLDGAQAAPHERVDLDALGVDYYAVSAHKMLGPTGVGALVVGSGAEDDLDTFLVGGDTVSDVTREGATFREGPARFEAGLQNYAGILGAGAAARYLEAIGMDAVREHEVRLNRVMTEGLRKIPGVSILGPEDPAERGGVTAFTFDKLGVHETAILLDDRHDVQVRSGDHCVHAWFNARGVEGSVRASAYLYNSVGDVERLVDGMRAIEARLR